MGSLLLLIPPGENGIFKRGEVWGGVELDRDMFVYMYAVSYA